MSWSIGGNIRISEDAEDEEDAEESEDAGSFPLILLTPLTLLTPTQYPLPMSILSYLFWPNPGTSSYGNTKVMMILVFCVLLILAAVAVKMWRGKQPDQMLRRLSRSWSSALLWFGVVGLVLTVARVEGIQYIAMRFWWVIWALAAAFFLYIQVRTFRMRYYQVLPTHVAHDPRDKYLPRKKR